MASLVDDYPDGWPRVAAFLNSADNFQIFRRFSYAHSRLLTNLMAKITTLEKRLLELDEKDAEVGSETYYRLRTTEYQEGWDAKKQELMDKLKAEILAYGKYS